MITKVRKEIDKVDKKIIKLLNQRAKIAMKIGKIKKLLQNNYYMPEREKEVLLNIEKLSSGPLSPESLKDIYLEVLNGCRQIQKVLKIAYFGPEATYTHQAAIKNFGRRADYVNCNGIADVFEEVEKSGADYGVVPIENSTEGMVYHTLDMFKDSDLRIVMEINMPIHHYLLSKQDSIKKLKKMYYHPQAYGQCSGWIKKNLQNIEMCESSSTADAARQCSKNISACAIASKVAAILYGLNILEGPIEDYKQNVTRFLVIGKQIPGCSGNDKTSVMFSIKDRVGALHDMLVPFKKHSINLTKIESRPTKIKAWNYIFYVDFLGHICEARVQKALRLLETKCSFLKILGSYPRGE
ncbi:MAG: prephenate dehydratase [bacterium]